MDPQPTHSMAQQVISNEPNETLIIQDSSIQENHPITTLGDDNNDDSANKIKDNIAISGAYPLSDQHQQQQVPNSSSLSPSSSSAAGSSTKSNELTRPFDPRTRHYYVVTKKKVGVAENLVLRAKTDEKEINPTVDGGKDDDNDDDDDDDDDIKVTYQKTGKRVRVESGGQNIENKKIKCDDPEPLLPLVGNNMKEDNLDNQPPPPKLEGEQSSSKIITVIPSVSHRKHLPLGKVKLRKDPIPTESSPSSSIPQNENKNENPDDDDNDGSSRRPTGTLLQYCIFCPKSFREDSAYVAHVGECNYALQLLVNFSKKTCLVCKCRMPFSVTGLLRHAISCIILERSRRLDAEKAEKELNEQKAKVEKVDDKKEKADLLLEKKKKKMKKEQEQQKEILQNNVEQLKATPKEIEMPKLIKAVPSVSPPVPPPARPSPRQEEASPSIISGHPSFTQRQREILCTFFNKQKFPTEEDRTALAYDIGLTSTQVKQWFERKRFKQAHNGKIPTNSTCTAATATTKQITNQQIAKTMKPGPLSKKSRGPNSHPAAITTILTAYFKYNMFPSRDEVSDLMEQTKLSRSQLHDWFNNARRKIPKHTRLKILESKKAANERNNNSKTTKQSDDIEERDEEAEQDSGDDDESSAEDDENQESVEDSNVHVEQKSPKGAACNKGKTITATTTTTKQATTTFSKPLNKSSETILKEAFESDPKPSILDIMRLSRNSGLPVNEITAWFAKERLTNSISGSDIARSKKSTPSVVLSSQVPPPHPVKRLSGGNDKFGETIQEDDTFVSTTNVKLMTIRQKLAAIKKLTCKDIKAILTERKPVIVEILLLFASSSIQQNFANECMDLAESLEKFNPFTVKQITYFCEWEDDFVIGMYPEKDLPEWKEDVDDFRVKILQTWDRVIVFASFAQCSLEEAAKEILNLNLGRNEKDDNNAHWEMVHIFRELEPAAVDDTNDPDF